MKRTHMLSAGGALVVLFAALGYILGPVLHTPLGRTTPEISVEMTESGGLFVGSNASYRGIVVGRVTSIDLTESGVRATVRLDPDTHVPKDSRVQVRSLSPIGEQYLDFQPSASSGPYLSDGDTIGAEAVDLPRTVADMSIALDRLISEVDPHQLRTVLSELGAGLNGAQDDLQRLLANSLTLIGSIDHNSAVITRLLSDSHTVLRIGADAGPKILRTTRSLAVFTHWLRQFQPELYRTMETAPGQIEELRKLVRDLTDVLPDYLDAQGSLAEILQARDPHLRTLLQSFPLLLEAFSSTMQDGAVQLDVIVRHGPLCDYDNAERDARDTTYRKLQENGFCSTSLTTYSQRGTQFAPPPLY